MNHLALRNLRHSFDLAIGEAGVTIRNGFKWANLEDGVEFDLVTQQSPEDVGTKVGRGVKVSHWQGEFVSLPASLLVREHNASARDYFTLLGMMRAAYGEQFTPKSFVTAMTYRRTE